MAGGGGDTGVIFIIVMERSGPYKAINIMYYFISCDRDRMEGVGLSESTHMCEKQIRSSTEVTKMTLIRTIKLESRASVPEGIFSEPFNQCKCKQRIMGMDEVPWQVDICDEKRCKYAQTVNAWSKLTTN